MESPFIDFEKWFHEIVINHYSLFLVLILMLYVRSLLSFSSC